MNITEFLEARITEDETRASTLLSATQEGYDINEYAARVLAECAAKRAIIARHVPSPTPNTYDLALLDVMRDLASVYKDHPDYRQEWAA